jgi:hypothetical protein
VFETARLSFEMVTSQNLCVQEAIPLTEKPVWPNLNPNQHNLPQERVLCQIGKRLPKLGFKVPRQTEQALVIVGPEKLTIRCTMGKLKITSLKEYTQGHSKGTFEDFQKLLFQSLYRASNDGACLL